MVTLASGERLRDIWLRKGAIAAAASAFAQNTPAHPRAKGNAKFPHENAK